MYNVFHFLGFLCLMIFATLVNNAAIEISNTSAVPESVISVSSVDSSVLDAIKNSISRPGATQLQSKQKRGSREIKQCPNGYDYVSAWCRNLVHPQAYSIRCSWTGLQPYGVVYLQNFNFNCRPSEFCVQSTLGASPVAFCITEDDMVRWAIENTSSKNIIAPASQVGLPPTIEGASRYGLEAILTGSNLLQSINATGLRIQAQRQMEVHGNFLSQTLPGGMVSCEHCASLTLDPVPDGTQSISVDFVPEEAGNFFLGSFIP